MGGTSLASAIAGIAMLGSATTPRSADAEVGRNDPVAIVRAGQTSSASIARVRTTGAGAGLSLSGRGRRHWWRAVRRPGANNTYTGARRSNAAAPGGTSTGGRVRVVVVAARG